MTSTPTNPIRQALAWQAEIRAMEGLAKDISDANLHLDPDLAPVIEAMGARITARRAELKALITLYGG